MGNIKKLLNCSWAERGEMDKLLLGAATPEHLCVLSRPAEGGGTVVVTFSQFREECCLDDPYWSMYICATASGVKYVAVPRCVHEGTEPSFPPLYSVVFSAADKLGRWMSAREFRQFSGGLPSLPTYVRHLVSDRLL